MIGAGGIGICSVGALRLVLAVGSCGGVSAFRGALVGVVVCAVSGCDGSLHRHRDGELGAAGLLPDDQRHLGLLLASGAGAHRAQPGAHSAAELQGGGNFGAYLCGAARIAGVGVLGVDVEVAQVEAGQRDADRFGDRNVL